MAKNTICLWYDKDAEAAALFYAATFPTVRWVPSSVHPVTTPPASRIAAGGAEAKRAFDAMMDMKKIDVAAIKAARRG
jgi:predicted 3-demethylubiquinone-9 3-methyltransferase (glyoxalase superfamily)